MTWYPTAFLPPQIENPSGAPYSGAVLKCYAAGTTTPIPMATDYLGLTTAASFALNASGYPTYQGTIIIPHLQENYKMALYPDQASADADSGAIWTIDNNQIASGTNSPFVQYFDGDGINGVFNLSQGFGTDPTVLLVFADRAIPNYTTNTDFATDTIWTKGAGWTIGAGVATAAGAISTAISQNAVTPIIQGQSYTVEFTVTAAAGTLTPSVGGNSGTTRGAGTWRETIIAGATQVLAFTGVGFTGTLDNASVKGIDGYRRMINRPDEMTLANNILTLQNIPSAGTKNVIVFAPSLLIGAASASAAAAAISEANALAYKNQAQVYATTILGTSVTSVTIGTGAKNFTTQASKTFASGQFVTVSSQATPANYMFGQVTSYDSGTGALVVDVTETGGAATATDWNISISGPKGIPGTVTPSNNSITFAMFTAGVLASVSDIVNSVASKIVTAANFKSGLRGLESYTLLSTQTAANVAQLDFTSLITSEFDEYIFKLYDIVPVTDSAALWMRTSTNNGSSFDVGASDYITAGRQNASGSATTSSIGNAGTVAALLSSPTTGLSTNTARSLSGEVKLFNPLNATRFRIIQSLVHFIGTTGELLDVSGSHSRVASADIDAVRFLMSTGNISSGTIRMYGVRKT